MKIFYFTATGNSLAVAKKNWWRIDFNTAGT